MVVDNPQVEAKVAGVILAAGASRRRSSRTHARSTWTTTRATASRSHAPPRSSRPTARAMNAGRLAPHTLCITAGRLRRSPLSIPRWAATRRPHRPVTKAAPRAALSRIARASATTAARRDRSTSRRRAAMVTTQFASAWGARASPRGCTLAARMSTATTSRQTA